MKHPAIQSAILMIALFIILINPSLVKAQSGGTVEGAIYEDTEEMLQGANIVIQDTSIGVTTDERGRFRLQNIPEGDYLLLISFISYQTKENSD